MLRKLSAAYNVEDSIRAARFKLTGLKMRCHEVLGLSGNMIKELAPFNLE